MSSFLQKAFCCPHKDPDPPHCHNTDTEHWCSTYHNYHDLAVQLCTEALSRYPAHNSPRLTICVLGEWVVSTWGLLSVCSAFNGLISENEMAASKTEAFWCPAGLLQEQGPGAFSAPRICYFFCLSFKLFIYDLRSMQTVLRQHCCMNDIYRWQIPRTVNSRHCGQGWAAFNKIREQMRT